MDVNQGVTDQTALPSIIERHLEFSVWLTNKVKRFPRDMRFFVGKYLLDNCYHILDGLITSFYESEKNNRQYQLKQVSSNLEKLRIGLRMAVSLKLINPRALHYASEILSEEGKMLGGWIKKERT
jgi:hypothetical protein